MFFIRCEHLNLLFIILLSFLLVNCQNKEVVKSHGIFFLENRDRLLEINSTNKNDVINILGQPHTRSIKDKDTWLYIERTRSRGKITKLGRNVLVNNNVLVIRFNQNGILEEKILYNKKDMNNYKFAEKITENDIKRGSFLESFLSSIREKMNANR